MFIADEALIASRVYMYSIDPVEWHRNDLNINNTLQ